MLFWGAEVKPGVSLKVKPEDGYMIHVSHVSLGETSKVEQECVPVYVKTLDDKTKLVIGNLSQKVPQVSTDIFFEKEFELSHDCGNSSVFLLGYQTRDDMDNEQDEELDSDFDTDEEEVPMDLTESGVEKSNGNDQTAAVVEAKEEDKSDSEMSEDGDEDHEDGYSSEYEGEELVELDNKKAKVTTIFQQKPSGDEKSGGCKCH